MKKNVKSNRVETKKNTEEVISTRKTCNIEGVGLSHYILVDKKAK